MTALTSADTLRPAENIWARRLGHPLFTAAVQLVLSTLFLLLICDWSAVYEEDEAAKAAEVMWLGAGSHWWDFGAAPDFYRKEVFSGYYLAATAFYKLSGLEALASLKIFSAVCGGFFFAMTPAFFCRAFGLPRWLSWIALLGIPALTTTFAYGNETALALAAVALSALALTFDSSAGACVGALGFASNSHFETR